MLLIAISGIRLHTTAALDTAQRYLQQLQMQQKQQSAAMGLSPSAYGQMVAVPTSAAAAAALSSQLAASGLALVPVPSSVVQPPQATGASYFSQAQAQAYSPHGYGHGHGLGLAHGHPSSASASVSVSVGAGHSAQSVASLAFALASPLLPPHLHALAHSPQKASTVIAASSANINLSADPTRDQSAGASNLLCVCFLLYEYELLHADSFDYSRHTCTSI